MRGDVGVVELSTTADTRHNDHPQPHGVEVHNKRHTFSQFRLAFFNKGPPTAKVPLLRFLLKCS